MNGRLLELVLEHDELAELDPGARRLALRRLVSDEAVGGSAGSVAELADAIDGFGPLSPLMNDERVTDILVNGPGDVWVERDGLLACSEVRFPSHEALQSLVDRLLGGAGVRIDASRPVASGRLADGSRMHAVLPPIAPDGPLVSIRRLPRTVPSLEELARRGMFDRGQRSLLEASVTRRSSLVISGGTGSGKTTLMNALLALVPSSERVVTIEETPELRHTDGHVVSLLARDENIEGRGGVDLLALVRAALRMRPDRIVVGEVRGGEALAALAAMSTGHRGSMLTIHARSAPDALRRMIDLALQAASGASEQALDREVGRAVDVVVHLEREPGGLRRVSEIFELPRRPT